jgi:hypothetical protein
LGVPGLLGAAFALFLLLPGAQEDGAPSAPDEEPSEAASAAAPRAPAATSSPVETTGPVETAGGGPVRESRAPSPFLQDLIDRAEDRDMPIEVRVRAVWRLARSGSDAAIDVLERLLGSDAPSNLKASIAEALGHSRHPDAPRILDELLASDDPMLQRGAMRGLAASGDPGAAERLESMLLDDSLSEPVRAQAALSLGALGGADARRALGSALAAAKSDDEAAALLDGLGELPFAETEDLFRGVLESAETSEELKVAALQALANADGEPGPLLLGYAREGDSPEVRLAALDSIGLLDRVGPALGGVVELLAHEESPEVRAAAYNALGSHARETHAQGGVDRLLPLIQGESDPAARLEGYRLVAVLLQAGLEPDLRQPFDAEMVSWLQDEALNNPTRYARGLAIDALRISNTEGAARALDQLSGADDAEVARAAEAALAYQERR